MENAQEGGGFAQGLVVTYAMSLAMIMVSITLAILFTALLAG